MAQKPRKRQTEDVPTAKGRFLAPLTTSRVDFLKNGSDDWLRDTIYRLVQALARLVACREAFGKELGLTGSQFTILMGVAYRQGESGITITSLSSYIGLVSTHVTTEVGRLIGKDLLIKRPNKDDGRSVLISLSRRGEEAVRQVSPMVRNVNDLLFRNIDCEQLATVNAFASTLLTNSEYALARIRIIEAARQEGYPSL
jgi:DNA-binding MarR family transcriptional regulator